MEVKKTVSVRVKYLRAEMGVRYFEDATVNGQPESENNDEAKIPLKNGDVWGITVDLHTGEIIGWPSGTSADVHYKICDAGVYKLLNEDFEIVIQKDGYVPSMLSPNEDAYGDYAIMKISETGMIDGWKADFSYFE